MNTSFHSCEWTKYSQTWSLKLKRDNLHNKKKVICESFIQQVNDPRHEVEGNIRTLGKTILTAPSGPEIKCIISNYFISSRTSRIYTCILNGRNSYVRSSVPPKNPLHCNEFTIPKVSPLVVAAISIKFKSTFLHDCIISGEFFTITSLYLVGLKYLWVDKITLKTFTSNSRKLN